MAAGIVVLGDELACAGLRLAGVQTRSPAPAALLAEFTQALASASMVVLTRALADTLPAETLRQAQRRETPLLVVLPDLVDPQPDLAFARRMRAVLGIEG